MSEQIYFIADTHFGDERIRRYENRPFSDIEEMDAALIDRWNAVVGKDDSVYVLGDFGASGCESCVLKKLNGKIRLIKGNHDTRENGYYRSAGFYEVYDLPVVFNGFWILSHEPLYVNRNMPYANIFGHVHGSPMFCDYSGQHYCVSVERIDYTPVSMEEIVKKVKADA